MSEGLLKILDVETAQRTILRRTGWLTISSASLVVNPVPENAERA